MNGTAEAGASASSPPSLRAAAEEVNFVFLEGVDVPAAVSTGASSSSPTARQAPADGAFSSWTNVLLRRSDESHTWRHRLAHALRHLGIPQPVPYLTRLVSFLTLLGVVAALFIFLIDLAVHGIEAARNQLRQLVHPALGFGLYLLSAVALCLLSTFWCATLSKEAEGSGLPQMKSILSGFYDRMKDALKVRVLFAKALGLICAIGGGLPVGWEGPNVHISCIIAHQLYRIPFFRELKRDRSLRLQTLAAACAVGLASSFGAPVGGVLYSIETMASFYLVQSFWKGVMCALAGAMIYDLLYTTPLVEAFEGTTFDPQDVGRVQIFLYAALGVLMGLLGALFICCVRGIYEMRMRRYPGTNRYFLVGAVATVSALVQYPVRLFALDPRAAINDLFRAVPLKMTDNFGWIELVSLPIVKFLLVAVSLGLPLPAGIFIPSFLIGAGCGRLFGEVLRLVFGAAVVPGTYAVVGAAAFTAGVTRALSCSVIIFEVTGQLRHMVPVLVAVLLAVIVGNAFNRSLYDTLVLMKQLPYMPILRRDRRPDMTVEEVMRRIDSTPCLFPDLGAADVQRLLEKFPDQPMLPVTDRSGVLLGAVSRRVLVARCQEARDGRSNGTDEVAFTMLDASEGDEDIDGAMEEARVGAPSSAPLADLTYRKQQQQGGRRSEGVVLPCDVSPLQVADYTLLRQLHFMFVMLMPHAAYVTKQGRLVGIVQREDLVQCGAVPES
ncbi:hypothetical protein CDCA_CDCA10G2905 [Cyanidium caldarium]|uniref:Chloride channel protein n=1 Tax=Cyanidium caldarium TaxID=2771 RepID=A0AAV9IXR3_CYACA|nr:hypothetical protein CDCA_CDCA10G2905 [Cyanidium caldarium]